jgi:hypothetical protein
VKSNNKRKLEKIEESLNLKRKGRRLAKVLLIKGQENFDPSTLDADVVLMRPYNGRCSMPKGLTYPEAFKKGPVIIWSTLKS